MHIKSLWVATQARDPTAYYGLVATEARAPTADYWLVVGLRAWVATSP